MDVIKSVFGLVEVYRNKIHQCCFQCHIYVLRSIFLMCSRFGQCIDKEGWGPF